MKILLSAFICALAVSLFADGAPDPVVRSTGDIDPGEWHAVDGQRVVLWSDANGNYAMPSNSPVVLKSEVTDLVASNSAVAAKMELLKLASAEALELTRLATYNISTVPTLFATPEITSFKLAVVIDPATFKMAITSFVRSDRVETKTIAAEGGNTNIVARMWTLDFATTDDMQSVTPDVICSQVLDGVCKGDPTFLLSELYSMEVISGEAFSQDGDSYSNFYRLSLWLPTYYDSCFIRLNIDPEAHAASTDGSVTDIGGVPDGVTGDDTWGDGTVIHYHKGLAVEPGSSYTRYTEE